VRRSPGEASLRPWGAPSAGQSTHERMRMGRVFLRARGEGGRAGGRAGAPERRRRTYGRAAACEWEGGREGESD
jgi:hypothetical protein